MFERERKREENYKKKNKKEQQLINNNNKCSHLKQVFNYYIYNLHLQLIIITINDEKHSI